MMQLSFQPAYDVFHTSFRFLRLKQLMATQTWHYDQLRIADFYLLFFFRVEKIRLKQNHLAIRRLAQHYRRVAIYQEQPDDRLVFSNMVTIQRAAALTLSKEGYFSRDKLDDNLVEPIEREEPAALRERISQVNESESQVMEAIRTIVEEYALLGQDGIKDRTGLLEYRYDAI